MKSRKGTVALSSIPSRQQEISFLQPALRFAICWDLPSCTLHDHCFLNISTLGFSRSYFSFALDENCILGRLPTLPGQLLEVGPAHVHDGKLRRNPQRVEEYQRENGED
jgi:hypothetical protein